MIAIIGFYTVSLLRCKPFLNHTLNHLEYIANFYLILGIFVSSIINQIDTEFFIEMLLLNIVLFMINFLFFLFWAWQFFIYMVLKYASLIKKKFPKIFHNIHKFSIHVNRKFINVVTTLSPKRISSALLKTVKGIKSRF